MIFYITLLFLVTCTSFVVSYGRGKDVVFVFKCITFLLISVPIAVRYNVGVDYFSYVEIFDSITYQGALYIEPGYWWLNYVIYLLGGNAQVAIAMAALITIYFFFKNVEKEKWFVYSILFILIIFMWCCTTIRQMIAASFAFYAWKKHEKGERFIPIIFIVIACLFHLSSILYPFIYLFCRYVNIGRFIAVLIFCFSLFITFTFGGWLNNFLANILADTMYGNYTVTEWFEPIEIGSGLGMILRYVCYFIILLFFPIDRIRNGRFIFVLFMLYVVIDIISIQITIINRIGRGFIFCYLPCVYYLTTTQYKYRQIASSLVWTILLVLFVKQLLDGFNQCSPYMSIFNS